jgi:hypothetical protein
MALVTEITNAAPIPRPPKRFKYHVLFSYASKNAAYVEAVHAALPKEISAFDYAEGGMWGEVLVKGLERRYKNDAPFCVVFISEAYLKSPHTTKELGIVVSVAKSKPGYMLPVMLNGAAVPDEIKEVVWLDETLSAEDLAARIVAKIREPPPKPWWFYVSLQVKVAAAAVLLALILFARPTINHFLPSRTSIRSVAADAQAITVHIANRGPKTSTLISQRLKFGALPIEDNELRLGKLESATIDPGERDVKLIALGLLPKCSADGNRLNNVEIEPLLANHTVTFEIDVQESDDAPGHPTTRIATIPAARLQTFVRKWVPSRVPPC